MIPWIDLLDLAAMQGQFILSLNDVPEIRTIFAGMSIEAVETSYTAAGSTNAITARELVISRAPIIVRQAALDL